MKGELGQSELEWKKQIQKLPNVRSLPVNRKKVVTEMVYKYLGFDSTKDKILKDTGFHIDINFSRIGRKVRIQEFAGRIDNYFEDTDIERHYIAPEKEYIDVWTPERGVKDKVVNIIGELYDSGYLQRLKSRNKDGIIDANFILTLKEKKYGAEKDQIDFAIELSVKDWEDIYRQSAKIGKMQKLDIVPVLKVDKHFCEIFDIEKSNIVMPGLKGFGLKDAWDETIGYSIAIIKDLLKNEKKTKKQLDYLALTTFFHSVNRLSGELINTYLLSELEKLKKIDSLPRSNKELKEFAEKFNRKYRPYFTLSKKEFIDLYDDNFNESTFYRRQKDYISFKNSLYTIVNGKKVLDFYTYYKNVCTKNPFGIFEK